MSDDPQFANATPPPIPTTRLQAQVRLAVTSVRTSSRIGVVLITLPALFLFAIIVHYGFGIPVPGLGMAERLLHWIERRPYVRVLSPLLLVGAPLLAVVLNLLAIVHVAFDRPRRELAVYFKLRAANVLIIAAGVFITALVFMHILMEAVHHAR
jgi:hypothetical protein